MSRRWGAIVVLLALAVVALGLLLWADHRADAADDALRAEVERVAGTGAIALLGHDHEDLDRSVELMRGVATPAFARTFAERFESEVAPAIEQAGTTADAEVVTTWLPRRLTSPTDVVVEVAATIDDGEQPRTTRTHLTVTVVEGDGGWRVTDIAGLTIAAEVDPTP